MGISVGNFVNGFQGFLGDAGIGLFPVGVQATTYPCKIPYEIVWSTDQDYFKSASEHTLLSLPSLTTKKTYFPNRISQIRGLFYSGPAEYAIQNDHHPFVTEYRQIQDIIDAASARLLQIEDPEREVPQIIEQVQSYGMNFGNRLYLTVLQSAFLHNQNSIERTARRFESLANFVPEYVSAYALLMEASAAYDERSYAGPAALAWGRALPLEPDPIWDPILLFAGLRRCLIAKNYDLMTSLLLRLRKLYPATGYEHDFRIVWSSLKSVDMSNLHQAEDWIAAVARMQQASCMWNKSDPTRFLSHWEDLSLFIKSAKMAADQ